MRRRIFWASSSTSVGVGTTALVEQTLWHSVDWVGVLISGLVLWMVLCVLAGWD